jgi:hypothetical protein
LTHGIVRDVPPRRSPRHAREETTGHGPKSRAAANGPGHSAQSGKQERGQHEIVRQDALAAVRDDDRVRHGTESAHAERRDFRVPFFSAAAAVCVTRLRRLRFMRRLRLSPERLAPIDSPLFAIVVEFVLRSWIGEYNHEQVEFGSDFAAKNEVGEPGPAAACPLAISVPTTCWTQRMAEIGPPDRILAGDSIPTRCGRDVP